MKFSRQNGALLLPTVEKEKPQVTCWVILLVGGRRHVDEPWFTFQSNQQLLHSLPMKICQPGPSPECATQPRSIYTPDPEYTELAGRKKIERTVRLEVTIGEDGQVHDMTVVKSPVTTWTSNP